MVLLISQNQSNEIWWAYNMTLFVVFDTSALFYSDSRIIATQYSGEVNVQNSTVMVSVAKLWYQKPA